MVHLGSCQCCPFKPERKGQKGLLREAVPEFGTWKCKGSVLCLYQWKWDLEQVIGGHHHCLELMKMELAIPGSVWLSPVVSQ